MPSFYPDVWAVNRTKSRTYLDQPSYLALQVPSSITSTKNHRIRIAGKRGH